MGETADQIRSEVDRARQRLAEDLDHLERHVKHEFDWRVHLERHPEAAAIALFSAAFLLGLLLPFGGRRSDS